MSDAEDGPGLREVAYRLFATEYDNASLEYSQSDEERAPNYVVTPSGARVNRLFVVGVLTAVESVNEETLRARIVDPTGAFVVYAGQYQPEAFAFFERAEPPAFVAVTGKANTFQPDGSDRVLTSLRPENVHEVDAETRDRWVVTAAEQTLSRVSIATRALDRPERGDELAAVLRESGVDTALADGIPRAIDQYGTTVDYLGGLRQAALDALAVVAERRDDVRSLSVAPDERTGEYNAAVLAELAPAAPSLDVDVQTTTDTTADVATATTASTDAASATAEQADGEAQATSEADESASAEESSDAPPVEATTGAAGDTGSATGEAERTTDEPSTVAPTEADTGSTPEADTDSTPEADSRSAPETGTSSTSGADGAAGDDTLGNFEPSEGDGSTDGETAGSTEEIDPETDPEELYELDDEERAEIESEYGVEFSTGTDVDEPGEADIDVPTGPDAETEDEAPAAEPTTDVESRSDPEEAAESAPEAESEPTTEPGADERPPGDADSADTGDESGEPEPVDSTDVEEESTDMEEEPADVEEEPADAEEEPADAEEEPADAEEASADADSDADASVDDVLLDRMEELDDGDGADREELIATVVEETGASEEAAVEAIDDALMSGQCYEPDETTLKPI